MVLPGAAGGTVEAGLPLALTDRPLPEWTVERANRVMHHLKTDFERVAALAGLPLLSASWRSALQLRVEKHVQPDAGPSR